MSLTPPRVFGVSFDTMHVCHIHIEDVYVEVNDENVFFFFL